MRKIISDAHLKEQEKAPQLKEKVQGRATTEI